MKQKLGIVLAVLVFGAILALALIHDSKASAEKSPDQAIKKTVLTYLNAVNSGDIDTMIEYVDDLRLPDKSDQKAAYSSQEMKETITDIVIKTIEPLSPTSYKVNFSANLSGTPADGLGVFVVYKYEKWLVVLGQQQPPQQ